MEKRKFYIKPGDRLYEAIRKELKPHGGLEECYGYVYYDGSQECGFQCKSLFIEFPHCLESYNNITAFEQEVDCNGHELKKGDILSSGGWGNGKRHFGIYDRTERVSDGNDAKIFARWQYSDGSWESTPGYILRKNVRFETRLPKQ